MYKESIRARREIDPIDARTTISKKLKAAQVGHEIIGVKAE